MTEQPITTDAYWDCECESQYIHPSKYDVCLACDTRRDEQPDSLISEVGLRNFAPSSNWGSLNG